MQNLLSICMLVLLAFFPTTHVQAAEKQKAYDIYLTGNRICKQCTGRIVDKHQVELENREGSRAIYPVSEIIGVDNHPVWRRVVRKSIHGNGLAGKAIVPYAFDDFRESVCRYCHEDP